MPAPASNGPRVAQVRRPFSLMCRVEVRIQSSAGRIWTLLTPEGDGSTTFVMQEHFSGLMLPIAGRAMPDLGPVFERYAADLKREAERSDAQR